MSNNISTTRKHLIKCIETFTEPQAIYSLTFLSRMFNDDISIKDSETETIKNQLIEYIHTFKDYQVLYSYTFLSRLFNDVA